MPDAKYMTDGSVIDYTPGSAVSAGDVVVQSELVGIALDDIAANEKGSLAVRGKFTVPKDTSTAFSAGDLVYWDVADNEAQDTADSGTNKQMGYAEADVLAATATMVVILSPA